MESEMRIVPTNITVYYTGASDLYGIGAMG